MTDSLFTKIINGEIPSYKIYEDDYTYAFLDIHPVATGHTLVVPKKQVEFVWDLDEQSYRHLTDSVKKIALHLRKITGKPYVGESILGIDVPHAHVHLIPFTQSHEMHHTPDANRDPDHDELAKLAAKLAF